MSGAYTRRGKALLASLERIQDSLQMVNDDSYRDLVRQVEGVKSTLDSIRRDFEREAKQRAKNQKNQDLVGRFGGVRKVKVFEMDAELAKLRGAKNVSLGDLVKRFEAAASRFE